MDFMNKKSVEKYNMSNPRDYRLARKKFPWIPIKRNKPRKNCNKIPESQKKLIDFIEWVPSLKGRYLYKFPKVKISRFEDFAEGIISKKEWDMLHYLPNYNGAFENIFKLNDFEFFDDLQEKLEAEGISFKNMFIKDVFAYELLRINFGAQNYFGFERISQFFGTPPLFSLTIDNFFLPSAADLSYVLTKLPAKELFNFFQQLVMECVEYQIFVPRILIWDGQFIHSNCKNNKEEGKSTYNDPDAVYCRHNGKEKGVGYDPGILYAHCYNHWFPIYFKMFPGNRNDIPAFRETLEDFFAISKYQWQVLVADSGPYSLQNMKHAQFRGAFRLFGQESI